GFGLVESDKLVKQNPHSDLMVFAIESNILSRVDRAARMSLERVLGEPILMDEFGEPCQAIQTSSESTLPALQHFIEQHPQIKRIVYRSDAVGSLLGDVFKPTKPQSLWF